MRVLEEQCYEIEMSEQKKKKKSQIQFKKLVNNYPKPLIGWF